MIQLRRTNDRLVPVAMCAFCDGLCLRGDSAVLWVDGATPIVAHLGDCARSVEATFETAAYWQDFGELLDQLIHNTTPALLEEA